MYSVNATAELFSVVSSQWEGVMLIRWGDTEMPEAAWEKNAWVSTKTKR